MKEKVIAVSPKVYYYKKKKNHMVERLILVKIILDSNEQEKELTEKRR